MDAGCERGRPGTAEAGPFLAGYLKGPLSLPGWHNGLDKEADSWGYQCIFSYSIKL